ncbi:translation elongation factor Ts [Candidatus Nomurabacteria bacterium RIFCSPHIGHO2_02_FULL_33_12]|nr:MAG: translation elongation factor Ts [Candidatus Nomurabacteria bacterium RIFCSPHIGHO2_02_FULL_33_12]
MSTINIDQIKALRDESGVSIMQCRKALEEAEGDMEKARVILSKKSSEAAAKKSERETSAGLVVTVQMPKKMAIFTLLCETDFVAKNDDFIKLTNDLSSIISENGIDVMQDQAESLISPVIQKIGENIRIGKVEEISGDILGSYVHNGKSGVIVSIEGGTLELARDIAMHIAAMRPLYTTSSDIDETATVAANSVFEEEIAALDKPEDMKAKILAGKLDAYFKEMTLMNQSFIKNPEIKIEKLLANYNAKLIEYKSAFLG